MDDAAKEKVASIERAKTVLEEIEKYERTSEFVPGGLIKALAYSAAEIKFYFGSKRYMGSVAREVFERAEKKLKKYRSMKRFKEYYDALKQIRMEKVFGKRASLREEIENDVKLARKLLSEGRAITEVFDDPASYCIRCGRPLSNPISRAVGMGPVCRRKC